MLFGEELFRVFIIKESQPAVSTVKLIIGVGYKVKVWLIVSEQKLSCSYKLIVYNVESGP